MAPTEVDVENEDLVRKRLYPSKPKSHEWKYAMGDMDAETSVQKKLLGRLVSRNIRDKVSATYRSRHVPTGGLGRRAYKRHVLRARTAEGVKVRRRTLPYSRRGSEATVASNISFRGRVTRASLILGFPIW